MLVNGHPDL